MREPPKVDLLQIEANLDKRFGLAAREIEFLPLGNDSRSWVYRVRDQHGVDFFLKLRIGEFDPACALAPRALVETGMPEAVAPLPARDGSLWDQVGRFTVLLYPFIEGQSAMKLGLTDEQWRSYGRLLRRMHTLPVSDALRAVLPTETFVPMPRAVAAIREIQARLPQLPLHTPAEQALAAIWRERSDEIAHIVDRAEALGARLRAKTHEFVLCHADIHTANVLVEPSGELRIVDWDQPILAPKERDLMFVIDIGVGASVAPHGERFIFEGYGPYELDPLALAYYRYEWVVQEIGDYAGQVFLRDDGGELSKNEAVTYFGYLFTPNDVAEAAYKADKAVPPAD